MFNNLIFHPYRRLQLKVFLVVALRFFLILGIGIGLYHGFYFVLNLSERLSIEMEKFFLYLYFFWGGVGIALLVREFFKISKKFHHYLEENFDIGFKWYNYLDYYGSPMQVPSEAVAELFADIDFSLIYKRICRPLKIFIIGGVGGWLVYPLLAMIFPVQQNRFLDNVLTVWNYREPYLEMKYPEYILQNQTFILNYKSDYPESFFQDGSQQWYLQSGENLTISNVMNDFNLEYRLRKGRIRETGSIFVKVIPPPQLVANVFTLRGSSRQNLYTLEGIYNLIGNHKDSVSLLLTYQSDQELLAYKVSALKTGTQISSLLTPNVSLGPLPYQLKVDLILRNEIDLVVQVQNRHRQWSEEMVFTLGIRKNHPPSVVITEPDSFIELDHPRNQIVSFVAKDDISLAKVTLWYQIVSDKGGKKSFSLTHHSDTLGGDSNPVSLWVSNFTLPLNNLNVPLGSTVFYYLRAWDHEQVFGYSITNQIKIRTTRETYTQSVEGGEQIKENLSDRREDFDTIERDYEKLKILSETKQIDTQDIKNFQENVKEFSDRMKQDIEKIDELEKDSYENKQVISDSFRNKLNELKKSLEELDKNYLEKINQRFQSLLNNFDKEIEHNEVSQFLQSIDLKQMESRVEQTLLYLDNLKKMQKIDALEQLSQNLYLRYKDLESYIISDLVMPEQIQQEATSIKEGIEFIKQEFAKVSPDLQRNPRIDKIKANINNQLATEKISAFDKLSQQYQDDNFLSKRSQNLDQLRRNFARLNSQNQDFNQVELISALNSQIISFNQKIEWLEFLEDGRIYDISVLEEKKKLDLTTQFFSKHKTLLFNFREQIFLLSSAATLELDFMEHYDKAIEKINEIQRKISPDQQQPNKRYHFQFKKNLTAARHATLILSRELILLKNTLKKIRDSQQQSMNLSRAMEMQKGFNRRIQEMLQKGSLSEREKQYLKNMAMEQSLLRSLMEEAEKSSKGMPQNQQGKSHGNNNGKGQGGNQGAEGNKQGKENGSKSGTGEGKKGNKSGNANKNSNDIDNQTNQNKKKATQESLRRSVEKKRRKIIDKMKQLEKELLRNNPDIAKIKELQKTIEDNLFRETQGLKNKSEEKNNERVAERDSRRSYTNNLSSTELPQEELKKFDRSVLDKLKKYNYRNAPTDFQERINRFIQLNSIP